MRTNRIEFHTMTALEVQEKSRKADVHLVMTPTQYEVYYAGSLLCLSSTADYCTEEAQLQVMAHELEYGPATCRLVDYTACPLQEVSDAPPPVSNDKQVAAEHYNMAEDLSRLAESQAQALYSDVIAMEAAIKQRSVTMMRLRNMTNALSDLESTIAAASLDYLKGHGMTRGEP